MINPPCCCGRDSDIVRGWRVNDPITPYTTAHWICYQCVILKSPLFLVDNRKPNWVFSVDPNYTSVLHKYNK